MLIHPNIDPVAISLGPLNIHWYGLMYLCGFAFAYGIFCQFVKEGRTSITRAQVDDAIFYGAIGIIAGARFGYVFFYGFNRFLDDPIWLFKVYEGGMSFHGGFIGAVIATFIFSKKYNIRLGAVADIVAVAAPMGLFFGRIGNFIGQELWGREVESDIPWGMIFPNDPLRLVRHPSQIYEALSEGLLIFIITFIYTRKPRPEFSTAALFVMCYGFFRFLIEFFREPDAHIGFDHFGWLTRGQLLSLPMAALGLIFFLWAVRRTDAVMSGVHHDLSQKAANSKT